MRLCITCHEFLKQLKQSLILWLPSLKLLTVSMIKITLGCVRLFFSCLDLFKFNLKFNSIISKYYPVNDIDSKKLSTDPEQPP